MSAQQRSVDLALAQMPSSEGDFRLRLQRFATLALDAMMEELRKARGGYRLSEVAMDQVLSACIDLIEEMGNASVGFDQSARDAQVNALCAGAAANDPDFQAWIKELVGGSPSSTG